MNAAGRLFLERGVIDTTVEDIAKQAGYSKSTVYSYFSSKIDIDNAIACNAMVVLKDRVAEAIESREQFHDQFEALCATVAEFQRDNPYCFKRLTEKIDYSLDPDEQTPWLYEVYVAGEQLNATIRDFVRRGMDLGILRQDLPVHRTFLVLWFAISGLVQVSAYKETYIGHSLSISLDEFLQYGLRVLLRAFEESSEH